MVQQKDPAGASAIGRPLFGTYSKSKSSELDPVYGLEGPLRQEWK
jgi:hypothetical protein